MRVGIKTTLNGLGELVLRVDRNPTSIYCGSGYAGQIRIGSVRVVWFGSDFATP